ncbi:hypothetical protein BD779DRAFT_1584782, partial [Infundibulicybe gibba]
KLRCILFLFICFNAPPSCCVPAAPEHCGPRCTPAGLNCPQHPQAPSRLHWTPRVPP